MKAFKEMIPFDSKKWAASEKMFHRVCFKTTVKHGTHGIAKTMSEFVFI